MVCHITDLEERRAEQKIEGLRSGEKNQMGSVKRIIWVKLVLKEKNLLGEGQLQGQEQ